MKKYIIVLIITLLSTSITYSQSKLLMVNGDTVNFGKVKPINSPLEATIYLKNIGTDSLKIYRVKPGCGCTTTKLDQTTIAPDSTVPMTITLNISNHPGKIYKNIALRCNDSDNPDRLIHLLADVLYPVQFSPNQTINFDNMVQGQETSGRIKIINTTDDIIVIKEIKTEPYTITTNLKIDTKIQPKGEIEIIAKYTPQNPGPLSGFIKLKTDYPDLPRIEIPVRGFLQQDGIREMKLK